MAETQHKNFKMKIKDPQKAPYNAFITTPIGLARYPWLLKPDTKFNPDGVYSVDLVLTEEEAQPLMDALTPLVDAWFDSVYNQAKGRAKAKLVKHYPWEEELDEETEEPTGNILLPFKQKAKVTRKSDGKVFDMSIALFTKDGRPYTGTGPIFGGSMIQVSCETTPYSIPATGLTGISFRMKAVMIHEFAGGGADAKRYGFDTEDSPMDDGGPSDDNTMDSCDVNGDF